MYDGLDGCVHPRCFAGDPGGMILIFHLIHVSGLWISEIDMAPPLRHEPKRCTVVVSRKR